MKKNKTTLLKVVLKLAFHYQLTYKAERRLRLAVIQMQACTRKEFIQDITTGDLVMIYRHWRAGSSSAENMRKRMGYLRRVLKYACAVGLIRKNPADLFMMPAMQSRPVVSLNMADVVKLEGCKFEIKQLERAKDVFLFMCYTGLSYVDMMNFTRANVFNSNGRYYLTGNRQKTNEEYLLPLVPQAKAILDKYNYQLPRYSNAYLNRLLKLVGAFARVSIPLTAHIGRKTFGQLMLDRGIRIETVARMLGHRNISMTQKSYVRVGFACVVQDAAQLAAA